MRGGNTVATNGGPLFAVLEIDGQMPGSSVRVAAGKSVRATIHIHCLHPLRKVQLYHRGNLVKAFAVDGKSGTVSLDWQSPSDLDPKGWFVVCAEDTQGDWAVTSPVYVESEVTANPTSTMALLEISNHERFIHLRREFFAHLIVTVSPDQDIERVELIRDGEVVKQFMAADASQLHEQRIPVTQLPGTYGPGAIWLTQGEQHVHLQADWPVNQTGWYAVRVVTSGGTSRRTRSILMPIRPTVRLCRLPTWPARTPNSSCTDTEKNSLFPKLMGQLRETVGGIPANLLVFGNPV